MDVHVFRTQYVIAKENIFLLLDDIFKVLFSGLLRKFVVWIGMTTYRAERPLWGSTQL